MRSINRCNQSWLNFTLWMLLGVSVSFAQENDSLHAGSFHSGRFFISQSGDSVFVLPHAFIISGTEDVRIDSILLHTPTNYILDARFGVLTIIRSSLNSFFSDTSRHRLTVGYRSLPFLLKPTYRLHESVTKFDTLSGENLSIAKPSRSFSFDDMFGSNLQKSGSLVRGFTVGSNSDLSLTSGFRMQMSGNITDDLQLVAALTDENSPIQPEGTTQTLQDVDKVFIELRGNNVRATLGDFDLNLTGTEFGILSRKLEGAEGSLQYRAGDVGGEFLFSGAQPRGKYASNDFVGIDGVQGPYELTGQNNERAIVAIAGTERVYIDGERMTRGETNDYTVDYSTAEITFTTKRLISHTSRITVDFEYSDRQYNRTLFAAQSQTTFADNAVSFTATAIEETDDENSPIDASLSSSDLDTLRSAGNNQQKASRSGVEYVGPGKGQYVLAGTYHDTLSGRNTSVPVYRFNPVDTVNAVYSITFSYVGPGNGYYREISSVEYDFDSLRQGSYSPVRYLPMPQSHALVDFALKAAVNDQLHVSGEYAVSNFDQNKFSAIDDDHNTGAAATVVLQYSPKNVNVGSLDIGSFDFDLKERYMSQQFVPLDRIDEVEFNRKWNLPDSLVGNEELSDGQMTYRAGKSFLLNTDIGQVSEGSLFSSTRYAISAQALDNRILTGNYDFDLVNTTDSINGVSASWLRERGTLQHSIGFITPKFRFTHELLLDRGMLSDTLLQSSYQYNEVLPGVIIGNESRSNMSAEVGWLWDDSLSAHALTRASHTLTQQYAARLQESESFSTTLGFTIQNKKFTDSFIQRNDQNIQTLLFRSQTQYNPLQGGIATDFYYEAGTERSPKLERVFQQVPKGTGNYIYLGDANGNHIIDAEDFQLSRFDGDYIALTLPTGELIPVIDVKTSARVRVNVNKLLTVNDWWQRMLSTLSTETYFRVDEKNSEPDTKNIYLLHFSRFLNDETTLQGSNIFTQDIYFLENHPEFNLRLQYDQRKGLTQYATDVERVYTREQSIRIRWQMVKDFSNQTDYSVNSDLLTANPVSDKEHGVSSSRFNTSWIYRPEQNVELVFGFGFGEGTNFDTTAMNLNDQTIRCTYALAGKGQLVGELTREEVSMDKAPAVIPFELTGGRVVGKSWLWRLTFNHQITQLLQASAQYDGRSEGGGAPVHTARAELRAMF